MRGLAPADARQDLLVGLDSGDDAAVVRVDGDSAVVAPPTSSPPVVDDAVRLRADRGRQRALRRLRDGRPARRCAESGRLAARRAAGELWPRCLRGGCDIAREAGCHLAGGHSIDDPEPKYGLAVTGLADPDRLLRNDAACAGQPISLTKPLGIGVLNNRHKATGEIVPAGRRRRWLPSTTCASAAALAAGIRAATDVTGFGLLGHLFKMARASGVGAVIDAAAVPYLDGAREAVRDGYVSGGTRRNLQWVRPHLRAGVTEEELLLLADAQTSGGLLVAGELPGAPVIGEFVPRGASALEVR